MIKTINRLEALFDAFMHLSDYKNPESKLYQLRNPLGLRVFTKSGQATDRLRKFDNLHAAVLASLFDLQKKCSGTSFAKLNGDNFNLKGLVRSYFLPDTTGHFLARFLRRALNDPAIHETDTPLSYFLEK